MKHQGGQDLLKQTSRTPIIQGRGAVGLRVKHRRGSEVVGQRAQGYNVLELASLTMGLEQAGIKTFPDIPINGFTQAKDEASRACSSSKSFENNTDLYSKLMQASEVCRDSNSTCLLWRCPVLHLAMSLKPRTRKQESSRTTPHIL